MRPERESLIALVESVRQRAKKLEQSGETKPDFMELITLLLEHVDDPDTITLVQELLVSEEQGEEEQIGDFVVSETQDQNTSVETAMPIYDSIEALDGDIERAREVIARELREAFNAVDTLKVSLQKVIKEKKEQHLDLVVRSKLTSEKRYLPRLDKETTIGYPNIHHRPTEEVLGAALKLWGLSQKTDDGMRPLEELRLDEQTIDEIMHVFNGEELTFDILRIFSDGRLHDLLRIEVLLSTYYPDDEQYKELLASIRRLKQGLKNMGVDISDPPALLHVLPDDVSDRHGYSAGQVVFEALTYVPHINQQVNGVLKREGKGKKIPVDIRTFGLNFRFLNNKIGAERIYLLSPSEWNRDPTDELRGGMY